MSAEWDSRSLWGLLWRLRGTQIHIKRESIITLPIIVKPKVFHAGTKLENEKILSNGGRVLCATSLGKDLKEAQEQSISACQ